RYGAPDRCGLRQHRTMTAFGFAARLTVIFSVISRRFFLKSVRIPTKNLYNLTKNPTATRTTIIMRCSLNFLAGVRVGTLYKKKRRERNAYGEFILAGGQ
ncbi:MAG: hypothetical protein K2N29_01140, partial [Ruminiclostridium sp.]|nr:hypothetical protein [Ruminiclostridium sp.]